MHLQSISLILPLNSLMLMHGRAQWNRNELCGMYVNWRVERKWWKKEKLQKKMMEFLQITLDFDMIADIWALNRTEYVPSEANVGERKGIITIDLKNTRQQYLFYAKNSSFILFSFLLFIATITLFLHFKCFHKYISRDIQTVERKQQQSHTRFQTQIFFCFHFLSLFSLNILIATTSFFFISFRALILSSCTHHVINSVLHHNCNVTHIDGQKRNVERKKNKRKSLRRRRSLRFYFS